MTTRRAQPGPVTTAEASPQPVLAALLANPAITQPLQRLLLPLADASAGLDARDPPEVVERMLGALERLDADSDTLVAAIVHSYPVLQQRLGDRKSTRLNSSH